MARVHARVRSAHSERLEFVRDKRSGAIRWNRTFTAKERREDQQRALVGGFTQAQTTLEQNLIQTQQDGAFLRCGQTLEIDEALRRHLTL